MQFRLCRENEYESVRRLWGQCFGEEEPWTSWFFAKHFRKEHTWVGEMDGRVVAQAHLLPHRLMVRGNWREAAFFVGVCVEEELRGKGFGRALMATALEELQRRGTNINILQPRWPDFYRQLGWDFCYDRQSYKLQTEFADLLLPEVPERFFWVPDLVDIGILADLYGQFTLHRHGYARREKKDWDVLLADHRGEGGRIGVVFCRNVPCAYVLYNMKGDTLHVREFIWLDPAVVDAIWKFLIGISGLSAVEKLEWLDPAGDPVSLLSPGSTPEPFLMGRMTDLTAALAEMDYPVNLCADLEIMVEDPLAGWNSGRFLWSIQNGSATLLPSRDTNPPAISIGIGQLSQLLFGYRSVRQLLAAGTVRVSDEKDAVILEQVFPACHNFISEYF